MTLWLPSNYSHKFSAFGWTYWELNFSNYIQICLKMWWPTSKFIGRFRYMADITKLDLIKNRVYNKTECKMMFIVVGQSPQLPPIFIVAHNLSPFQILHFTKSELNIRIRLLLFDFVASEDIYNLIQSKYVPLKNGLWFEISLNIWSQSSHFRLPVPPSLYLPIPFGPNLVNRNICNKI